MLGKVEKILRKTSAGKKFLKELKSAVRDGTKTVDRAVRDATNYINKKVGPSTKLTRGQQQVKPATKAQTVTGNVAKTKYRQGVTAGTTTTGGGAAAVSGTGKENLSTAQKDMIAAYRAEARKETSSDKQLEKKVAAFKKDFIDYCLFHNYLHLKFKAQAKSYITQSRHHKVVNTLIEVIC